MIHENWQTILQLTHDITVGQNGAARKDPLETAHVTFLQQLHQAHNTHAGKALIGQRLQEQPGEPSGQRRMVMPTSFSQWANSGHAAGVDMVEDSVAPLNGTHRECRADRNDWSNEERMIALELDDSVA